MSDPTYKPKVSSKASANPVLKQAEIDFMRIIEEKNRERVLKLQKIRRNNIFTAAALGITVLGIYGYSIAAIKQETFLDDFDEPAKIVKQ